MKKIMMILVAAVVLALFVGAGSADTAVGGDRGIIQVHCNVADDHQRSDRVCGVHHCNPVQGG